MQVLVQSIDVRLPWVVKEGMDLIVLDFVLDANFEGVVTQVEGSCPCFSIAENKQQAFDGEMPLTISVSIDTSKIRLPKELTFLFYTTPPIHEIANSTIQLIAEAGEK